MMLWLIWAHVIIIPVFALARGYPLWHSLLETLPVAAAGLAASWKAGRRLRSGAATIGILTSSAILVHLSGGVIEVHFHFFVMLSIIALYNDWFPFLLALSYVVLHHGTIGILAPEDVYNHPAAINGPWKWAAIHGIFVLMASIAGLVAWRLAEEARERSELILNSAGEGIFGLDQQGLTTFVNPSACAMLGQEGADLIGRPMHSVLHHSHQDGTTYPVEECPIHATAKDGRQRTINDEVFWKKDGTSFPIEYTAEPIRQEGDIVGVVVSFMDVTESRDAEQKLKRSQAQLAEAQQLAAVGSWEWNIAEDRIYWSDEMYRILGLTPVTFGATAEAYRRHVHPEDVDLFDDAIRAAIIQNHAFDTEHRIVRPDGTVRVIRAVGKVLRDDSDTATSMIGSAQDITERKGLEERLKHDALHDSLTALPNRVLFRDRVHHALERAGRTGRSVAVMFVDLDNFKNVNDTLGHATGDELLQAVADRLLNCLRISDTAARLGGDEFAVLLEETEEAGAIMVAERMLASFQEPVTFQGIDISVRASIGIAVGGSGKRVDDLLRGADTAMYAAKRQGRNRYDLFQPAMHYGLIRRLEMQSDLEKALSKDEITLHYQPIYRLDPFTVVGVEALARWQHPSKGMIPPMEFIPVAEETGLIHPLGKKVLDLACKQLQEWGETLEREEPLHCAVNFAAGQIESATFSPDIVSAIERYRLRPDQLVIEITEDTLVDDRGTIAERLQTLAEAGVVIAIDDFGTGYSSLSYLRRFPVKILKLDSYFLKGIENAPEEAAYAKAIVRLGHSIGLDVVAEGIETKTQLAELMEVGCDFGQGFLFSKPLPPEDLSETLSSPRELLLH